MLTQFIVNVLKKAKYKKLEDSTYYGEVAGFRGVWANTKTLVACRPELREVLENWLLLKIQTGESVKGFKFGRSLATRYA